MLITVLTLFPEMFPGPLGYSLLGKSLGIDKKWQLKTVNIRDFATDKHKKVDDKIYGGGAGMLIKPDVVDAALRYALEQYTILKQLPKILFMTPSGKTFNHSIAKTIVKDNNSGIILLCGRYEGIDHRVIQFWKENHNMQEISIGDFIVFGGEVPAMIVIEACMRQVRGIISNPKAIISESFSVDLLEYPQYTKPNCWKNINVPKVLLNGNHQEINNWNKKTAVKRTIENRIDLWSKFESDN